MNTRWENWEASLGQVTAEYEVYMDWKEFPPFWVKFKLFIGLEVGDRFCVNVTDWEGRDVIAPKRFESLKEAVDYLSDVDCEKYVDTKWEEFQKMI